ncbi:hypothetical protein EON80_17390 [bacterium]|nr:MAG: hypothetical protein EON80_17390 [bacterium]
MVKNKTEVRTRPIGDEGEEIIKRGWKAEAKPGNHLLLTMSDIHNLKESAAGPVQREEKVTTLDIPLKNMKPELVKVKTVTKKKGPIRSVSIGVPTDKWSNMIMLTMSNKVLPLDAEGGGNFNTESAMQSFSFTLPDAAWSDEFAAKLKEVVVAGSK